MAGRVLFIAIGPSFSLLRIKKKGGSVSLKAHPYGRAKFIIKLTPQFYFAGIVLCPTLWYDTKNLTLREGPATHLCLVLLVCRSYETKHDFVGPSCAYQHFFLVKDALLTKILRE